MSCKHCDGQCGSAATYAGQAWLDHESGDEWQTTEEYWRCRDCGVVGPAEAKVQGEVQGDGAMTGLVYIDTGDYRCADCGSENVTEMRGSGDETEGSGQ